MRLFKRIGDIISANLNDLTDHFEDPEAMLRQAIREMETSINEVTEQTAKAMANEKTLTREWTATGTRSPSGGAARPRPSRRATTTWRGGPCRARKSTRS